MTDPERISKRSAGLASQLLQAAADEQPADAGVQRTLAALGVSVAVVTSSSVVGAASAGAKTVSAASASAKAVGALGTGAGAAGGGALSGGAVQAVSATLLAKWIGIGVLGGVGLAGAAAVATSPSQPPSEVRAPAKAPAVSVSSLPASSARATFGSAPSPEVVFSEAPSFAAPPRVSAREPVAEHPPIDVGAPLAEEVAYVDHASALLSSGRTEQGLALLQGYEAAFPEARLLPEVLFLRLETCDRLGRTSDARAAAQRLLSGFPSSPHAARARSVLAR